MRRLVLVLSCLVGVEGIAGASPVIREDHIRAATIAAVHQRMGAGVQVIVDVVQIFSAPGDFESIDVAPNPDAQIGEHVVCVLRAEVGSGASRRALGIGHVVVNLHVTVEHAIATRAIMRGQTIGPSDVVSETSEVTGVPLRRLPTAEELVGARVLRNVAEGAVVVAPAVATLGAVRSGQEVRAVANVGGAEVSATLVSLQNGQIGDVIRVVNRDTRRELRARVVGTAAVEVIHE